VTGGSAADTGLLRIATEQRADAVVVRLRGPFDVYTSREARERLDAIVVPGARVVVDVGEVTIIDSSGLSTLLRLCNRVESAPGGRFGLASPRRRIRHLLNISGLGDAFVVARDARSVTRAWAGATPPPDAG
jgi:anti-anti-sigma factor